MNFQKDFNEAVLAAVIRKLNTDAWEQLPWLAAQVELATLKGLTPQKTVERAGALRDIDQSAPWPTPRQETAVNLLVENAAAAVVAEEVEKAVDDAQSDSFISNSFDPQDGYPWRILVSDRWKDHRNSHAVHFSRPPTQEEFEEQHKYFHARTHWVHVNKWNGAGWDTITQQYDPTFIPNHGKTETPVETFTATDEWPEGKSFRIKFWDQRINAHNYVYFEYRPSGLTLHRYHKGKEFAVVEPRPVDA